MERSWSFVRKETGILFGFTLLVVTVLALSLSPRAADVTHFIYDPLRETAPREEVIIIGIDDKSLQTLGAWPWDRSIFSRLTKVLDMNGVKATVYDVLFLEPRAGDEEFRAEIASAQSPIILASKLDGENYLSSYLAYSTSTARVVSSLANVEPERDGKVRSYPQTYRMGDACVRGLAESAFFMYVLRQDSDCERIQGMFRYPELVTTYSLVDVVEGIVPPENLKGKVAFIGATAPELEDNFVGLDGTKIPGVYVHASIFTSLLNSVQDVALTAPTLVVTILFFMLLTAYLMYRIRNVARQVIVLLLLVLGAVTIAVITFSYGIQLPIVSYVASILVSAGYVIGTGFMMERKKNAYIQSIFSKYVHKDVLDELISSGGEVKLGGERRDISILFSDIRGFTSMSEILSPEELTSTLNAYLSAMTPEILEEKGTVDKFIGDAIMAFWNAPLPIDNHAERAVRSGLRMLDALSVFNEDHEAALRIGIGIHRGQATVGNVGGKDHVNYTALGDTVNLASRLEGLTKKYGVSMIVTKAVRDAVTDERITFRCLDVVRVLGKTNPTTIYEPRWKQDFEPAFIENYERALQYYYHKEWKEAEEIFSSLEKTGDAPSKVLLERIPVLRKNKKWDGVWEWDEK